MRSRLRAKLAGAAGLVALALMAAPTMASAATYSLNPLPVEPTTVSTAGVVDDNTGSPDATTFTDYFLFTIAGTYDTTLSGDFFVHTPDYNDDITDATLSLYQGTPGGGGTFLASTGPLSIDQTTGTYAYAINQTLSPGVNYYLEAMITVPGGDKGDYSISATAAPMSAAPEPGVWMLMIAGIGLVGTLLRRSRRSFAALA